MLFKFDLIVSSMCCLITRVDVIYCNSSAVAAVGKGETAAGIVAALVDVVDVIGPTADGNVDAANVVADVVAATDVDKPPDGTDLVAVPAGESSIATSPTCPRVKPIDNKSRPLLLVMASGCFFLMWIASLSRRWPCLTDRNRREDDGWSSSSVSEGASQIRQCTRSFDLCGAGEGWCNLRL
jgi:hypothetical protein